MTLSLNGRLETTLSASSYRNSEEKVAEYIRKALEGKNNSLTKRTVSDIISMMKENSVLKTAAVDISTYDYDLASAEYVAESFMDKNMLNQVLLTDDLFEELITEYSEKDLFYLYKDMIDYGYCPKDIIEKSDNQVAFKENFSFMFETGICAVKSIMNRIDSTQKMDITTFTVLLLEFVRDNVELSKMYIVDDMFQRISLSKSNNNGNPIPLFALDAICSVIYKRTR
ncbi:MAG: hypothetical protein ACRC92_20435 [Peptostreptococcaceae bacterium]